MKDNGTGKTIAVFGMDYPAEIWNTEAGISYSASGCYCICVIYAFICFLYNFKEK